MADDLGKQEMQITVRLPREQADGLKERAAALGMDASAYAGQIVDGMTMYMTRDKSSPDRVIFDESIYRRALLAPYGPEAKCVAYAKAGWCELIVTRNLIAKVRREMRDTDAVREELAELLRYLKKETQLQSEPLGYTEFRQDKWDCVNLAMTNRDDGITLVSRKPHVLELADVTWRNGEYFAIRCPTVRIVDPVAFIIEREAEPACSKPSRPRPTHEHEQARVLDVARRAVEASRLSRVMDRFRGQNKDKGHEK